MMVKCKVCRQMLYNCTHLTLQELVQFKTTKGQLKKCELTLCWPEEMTFTATATKKMAAEKMAAALACLKLKVRIIVGFFFSFGGGGHILLQLFTSVLTTCIGAGNGTAG